MVREHYRPDHLFIPESIHPKPTSQRREHGLDFINGYFTDATEALVYLVPHAFDCDFNIIGYPNYGVFDSPFPFARTVEKGEILLPPIESCLWILRPEKFIPEPVYHQSSSASLIESRMDEFLLPGLYFRYANTKRNHFNLGALVRAGNPLANLVRIQDFLDHPFPVLYVIDTAAKPEDRLPAIPRLFVDTLDELKILYGGDAAKLRLRNPKNQIPLPPVEGKRIIAIVVPNKEIKGSRFHTIVRQARQLNPDIQILRFSELAGSVLGPELRARSCDELYRKVGLTISEVKDLMKSDLVRLFASEIGIGSEDVGIFNREREIDEGRAINDAYLRLEKLGMYPVS